MKKAFSVIFNILTFIAMAIFLILTGFCIYDWIIISKTAFADSYDFWLVIDYYAKGMFIFSVSGFVFSLSNFLINLKSPVNEKIKKRSLVFTMATAVGIIISIILYFLPFNF